MSTNKIFPNGFTSWMETHHEVVSEINSRLMLSGDNKANRVMYEGGAGAIYELAEELTDKFEEMNKNREWDGEFFDEIEEFMEKELDN